MEQKNALIAFSALSQATRMALLQALVAQGPLGLSAGTLAKSLDTSPPNLSFHLKELERAELICQRREGRKIFYMPDYAGIRALVDFLLSQCCQGDPRLCGPYTL